MSLSSSPTASAPASPAPPNPQSTKKPRFSTVEKELIAKLRSKSETKLGFRHGPSSRNNVDKPVLPPFYPTVQVASQQHWAPPSQQQMNILFHPQVTDLTNSPITAATKVTAQPHKNPIPSPSPLAQTVKLVMKTPFPDWPEQSSQSDRKSHEPVNEQNQKQIPHQRNATCPLGQPDSKIPPQLPPMPKQHFSLPTREQTSLAEQKRREAQKETPITCNEREMSQKEIHYAKSLLMCFLSGRGNDSPKDVVSITKKNSGCDDATSERLDCYQHDPLNHEMAYHYSIPTLQKKRKFT
jgi:hypothetical protein